MDIEAENREFIKTRINPILERMIVDILVNKPKNVVFSRLHQHFRLLTPGWFYERMDQH